MRINKILFFSFILLILPLSLFSTQLIIEKIEIVKNYKIIKTYFDYSIGDFYLKDFKNVELLIEKKGDIKNSINSIFNNKVYIDSNTLTCNYSTINDKIILKKFLILDTSYQILDINKKKFYKFKIYIKKNNFKNSLLKKIIDQYKIEYGLN